MELELGLVTISLAAAMVRADEASPSVSEVKILHMKSEITCPSVRCMRAKEAMELWSVHVEVLCQS
jgi:hypothetical protein